MECESICFGLKTCEVNSEEQEIEEGDKVREETDWVLGQEDFRVCGVCNKQKKEPCGECGHLVCFECAEENFCCSECFLCESCKKVVGLKKRECGHVLCEDCVGNCEVCRELVNNQTDSFEFCLERMSFSEDLGLGSHFNGSLVRSENISSVESEVDEEEMRGEEKRDEVKNVLQEFEGFEEITKGKEVGESGNWLDVVLVIVLLTVLLPVQIGRTIVSLAVKKII